MMKENETLKMIEGLTKNLEEIINFQKKSVEQIPSEHNHLKVQITNDIESILKSVKGGEVEKLIEIQKRYASSNS